ncbi:uncharacterized protein LAESUDRAFT_712003 [Laetiporus sulphureus 93-53]|uniref:Uncharacterized protein n=1 Tax=Laetiporus sulphureus 93-53 TaxID=1314785 RepID=A0A165FV76_9APHY|nr:uncharacterized protein LAESUDRAFT_712003 [Laetiporus sulphureus 93-53]KZT09455.1 hypothetical protein LAESUDRAFT_712003 [Laetiporus sulphureus 93-53]
MYKLAGLSKDRRVHSFYSGSNAISAAVVVVSMLRPAKARRLINRDSLRGLFWPYRSVSFVCYTAALAGSSKRMRAEGGDADVERTMLSIPAACTYAQVGASTRMPERACIEILEAAITEIQNPQVYGSSSSPGHGSIARTVASRLDQGRQVQHNFNLRLTPPPPELPYVHSWAGPATANPNPNEQARRRRRCYREQAARRAREHGRRLGDVCGGEEKAERERAGPGGSKPAQ